MGRPLRLAQLQENSARPTSSSPTGAAVTIAILIIAVIFVTFMSSLSHKTLW
jgi:hypothetical protein